MSGTVVLQMSCEKDKYNAMKKLHAVIDLLYYSIYFFVEGEVFWVAPNEVIKLFVKGCRDLSYFVSI